VHSRQRPDGPTQAGRARLCFDIVHQDVSLILTADAGRSTATPDAAPDASVGSWAGRVLSASKETDAKQRQCTAAKRISSSVENSGSNSATTLPALVTRIRSDTAKISGR